MIFALKVVLKLDSVGKHWRMDWWCYNLCSCLVLFLFYNKCTSTSLKQNFSSANNITYQIKIFGFKKKLRNVHKTSLNLTHWLGTYSMSELKYFFYPVLGILVSIISNYIITVNSPKFLLLIAFCSYIIKRGRKQFHNREHIHYVYLRVEEGLLNVSQQTPPTCFMALFLLGRNIKCIIELSLLFH